MIVPMKKAFVLSRDKDKKETLKKLRNLGVLHIEKSSMDINSERLNELHKLYSKAEAALQYLPETEDSSPIEINFDDAENLIEDIHQIERRQKEIEDRLIHIGRNLDLLKSWDNIDPDDIHFLKDNDISIHLYRIIEDEVDLEPYKDHIVFLEKHGDFDQVLFYAKGDTDLPEWDEVELPEQGLKELHEEKENLEKNKLDLEDELEALAQKRPLVEWYITEINKLIEFEDAKLRFSDEESISCLNGFVPEDTEEVLKHTARSESWGLILSEPELQDEVPTKLKVGKFSGLLSPVMDFLGITPGYREMDISFFFLIFFTIFTSMLIGDAGYGLIFLSVALIGMIVSIAKGKSIGKPLVLLSLLSIGTIAWGALTGTWFASKALMEIPLLQKMKIGFFTGSDEELIKVVMGVSFLLGVVQLSLGVVQGFLAEFPKLKSLARIGWLAVTISIYSLILTLVIDREGIDGFSTEMTYLLFGGVAFIFLFGSQETGQSFIKGVLKAFANFLQNFLDVVGTFSNLMSYVRLFAVGLAAVKIAETFNLLAANMSDGWTIVFSVLIIVLGHTLNIVLGAMAILVHAIRLNILEYSGQIGIEWSGFKYDPFRVRINEEN